MDQRYDDFKDFFDNQIVEEGGRAWMELIREKRELLAFMSIQDRLGDISNTVDTLEKSQISKNK